MKYLLTFILTILYISTTFASQNNASRIFKYESDSIITFRQLQRNSNNPNSTTHLFATFNKINTTYSSGFETTKLELSHVAKPRVKLLAEGKGKFDQLSADYDKQAKQEQK